jgi:hypothetical protein
MHLLPSCPRQAMPWLLTLGCAIAALSTASGAEPNHALPPTTDITLDETCVKSQGLPCPKEFRFASGQTIAVEAATGQRYVGRYWSPDGRIKLPHEGWATDAFLLGINGATVTNGWRFVSAAELPKTDRGARHHVVELANTTLPFTVKVHTLLDGTPVLTRWLELQNRGPAPLALTALAPWAGELWPGNAFSLGYFTNQDWSFEGWFQWKTLPPGVTTVTCDQARSHDDPFFIVRNETTGEYFIGHLAWTTNWRMEFERTRNALLFRIGPWADTPLRVLAPGETIPSPAVHLGHVSGDLDAAVQAMHDHLRRFVLPTRPRDRSQLIQYLVPADQGYYLPFDESSALKCVDVAAAIGAELFILDYGWWDITGDWTPSATRFPRGLDPLIDAVHRKGMLFGLYVRAEGDSGDIVNSRMGRQHPDWLGPSGTIKLQNPGAAQWVESEICRMVRDYRLDLYRLDYNPSFKFGTTPRNGFPENDCWGYYEAFYASYERIHRKFPKLILQEAAAGGARNDLGTVSRFHEPYLTDGLWFPRELQVFSGQTLALPPENFVILHMAHGSPATGLPQKLDTILRLSFATSTPQIFVGTVAPSVETLSPERRARFLHYAAIYKGFIRPLLPACKVFHHEPVNAHGGVTSSGWFAMEFAAPDRAKAWALIVRTGDSPSDTYRFQPRGLDLARTYRVTWDSRNATTTIPGDRLILDGLPIRLESIASSELLLFEAR